MIKTSLQAAALVALCSTSLATYAMPIGSVTRLQGVVMVNQGEKYTTAYEGTGLSPGDRVMTLDGGTATLTFDDGCVYTIESNRIFKLTSTSPCGKQANLVKRGPTYAALGNPPPVPQTPWYDDPLIGGGLILGGGVAAYLLTPDNNNRRSISP